MEGGSEKRRWFEFLLDENLLVQHLKQPYPDPPAWELAQELLSNNHDQSPEKATKRKVLALRIAALNRWDLNTIMAELPVQMQYSLLCEYTTLTKTEHPSHLGSPHEAFAYSLYCRWVLRYLFRSQVPVRGARGLVVAIPGQTDPFYVSPEVMEKMERTTQQEAEPCAAWLHQYILNPSPAGRCASDECFSVRIPHFSADRGEWVDPAHLRGLLCFDLGTYYFFNQRYPQAGELLRVCATLLPKDHKDYPKVVGYLSNFEDAADSTDDIEMSDSYDILGVIDSYLESKPIRAPFKLDHQHLSLERQLLISQEADQILALSERIPKGNKLNSEWQHLPPHLQALSKQSPLVHVLLAKALELRKLEKYSQASKLLQHIASRYSNKYEQINWELAFTSLVEGKNEVASAKLILNASRSSNDMPYGMIDLSVIELLNHQQYALIADLEPRGAVMGVIRSLGQCCLSKQAGCGHSLWKVIVPFLLVKRNRNAADGCQALTFTISKINNSLAKAILISLFAHLYNILRDDSNSTLSHEYLSFWPSSLQDATHYCLETCSQMLQNCLYTQGTLSPFWLKTLADLCFDQNYYSVALKHYIEAIISVTNFITEPPSSPSLIDDTLYRRMALCCAKLSCHTQAAILYQFMLTPDYCSAFKSLNEKNCNDSCDSLYSYIWDSNILEFLANLHAKRGEIEAKKAVLTQISSLELNANNPKSVLEDAATLKKAAFLRTLAKQYL